ncbi:hypothetical protein HLB23_14345 [Nocardia uniformis]|uniref:Uncharacterized protein n=1 Tax=Nocardia uniformis TaxID=53432 RepID=A0A849C3L1_9NOCA|nr:hypothetical protein [Nocardia uniformis]NNH71030.1 hypothetical protein [Nocardia uniformis]
MSNPIPQRHDPPEAIRAIRILVQAKNLRMAKQQVRQLQKGSDDATWAMIVEIANTLRFKTDTVARTKLRKLWRDNEQFRPLIEACVSKPGERQYIPEPPKPAQTTTTWASKVDQRVDPGKRIEPSERVRTPNTKIIHDYEKSLTRAERDDPGTDPPEPDSDPHDYDQAAVIHISTSLCVSCRLERPAIDDFTERVQLGRGVDGLCDECRSLGRPGLPELPAGHTLTDQVHARLDYLAEHFHTDSRGLFRQEWRYADQHARPIISAWVKTHTTPDAETAAPPRHETIDLNSWCRSCGEYRQLSDRGKDLCFDCDPHCWQSVAPAGSIAVRHEQYQHEFGTDTAKPTSTPPGEPPKSASHNTSAGRETPPKTERTAALAKSPTASKVGEPPVSADTNAWSGARALAQERRRAISRRPDAVVKRSIR